MESIQDRLNKELSEGKSIAWWAMGYYVSVGNQFSPSLKVPIFNFIEQSKSNTMALIEYLGSMMWINVRPETVFYGWGKDGENSPSYIGKKLRLTIEGLKQ